MTSSFATPHEHNSSSIRKWRNYPVRSHPSLLPPLSHYHVVRQHPLQDKSNWNTDVSKMKVECVNESPDIAEWIFSGISHECIFELRKAMDLLPVFAVDRCDIRQNDTLDDVSQVEATLKQLLFNMDAYHIPIGTEIHLHIKKTASSTFSDNFQSPSLTPTLSTVNVSDVVWIETDPVVKSIESLSKQSAQGKSPCYTHPHQSDPVLFHFHPPQHLVQSLPKTLQSDLVQSAEHKPTFNVYLNVVCSNSVHKGVHFNAIAKMDYNYVPLFRLLTPDEKKNQYLSPEDHDPDVRRALGNSYEFKVQDILSNPKRQMSFSPQQIKVSCNEKVFDMEDYQLVVARPQNCSMCHQCVMIDESNSLAVEYIGTDTPMYCRLQSVSPALTSAACLVRALHSVVSKSYDQWTKDSFIVPVEKPLNPTEKRFADSHSRFNHLAGQVPGKEVFDQLNVLWNTVFRDDKRWQEILHSPWLTYTDTATHAFHPNM